MNMIEIHFEKSFSTKGQGFEIKYKSVPSSDAYCGGVYRTPGEKISLTLNDQGEYMPDLECYWTIIAPYNKHIYIDWKSFELEESNDCNYDYIEIYDQLITTGVSKPLARYDFILYRKKAIL